MVRRSGALAAAVRLYALHGFQGATTRLIAAEADVNEVTLFRLFGSKEALLDEAIAQAAEAGAPTRLPAEPRDPERELAAWCKAEIARLAAGRAFLRQCFAEAHEHPLHGRRASGELEGAAAELRRWLVRLQAAFPVRASRERRETAVAMLLGALVTDALAREDMPGVFTLPPAGAPRAYARLFLEAIGIDAPDAAR